MKSAPILLIIIYIGLFFFLSNAVEETVVDILKENNANVKVDSVSIPYSSPISNNYLATVFISNKNKREVVDFRVRGHFWSGISVSVSGMNIKKIKSLAGKWSKSKRNILRSDFNFNAEVFLLKELEKGIFLGCDRIVKYHDRFNKL